MTVRQSSYVWKFSMDADAQKVGEEIEAIHEQKSGVVTPQDVVTAAQSETSEMHPLFTWDDSEAAQKQRRGEASYILRNLIVVVQKTGGKKSEPQTIPVRAMINARTDTGRGYMPISVGMADSGIRAQILETALSELNAWRRKYENLEDLAGIFAAIDATGSAMKKAA